MALDQTIDLSSKILAIRAKYGEKHWQNKGYYEECANLWGAQYMIDTNEAGVFLEYEIVRVACGDVYYEFELYCSPSGLWTYGLSHSYGLGGKGYAPSISCRAFLSRDAVLKHAVNREIEYTENRLKRSDSSAKDISVGKKLIYELRSLLNEQMDLFGGCNE